MANEETVKTTHNDTTEKAVVFENCKTYGDEVEALTKFFTGSAIGAWVLDKAAEKVRANDKRIQALVEQLKKEAEQ